MKFPNLKLILILFTIIFNSFDDDFYDTTYTPEYQKPNQKPKAMSPALTQNTEMRLGSPGSKAESKPKPKQAPPTDNYSAISNAIRSFTSRRRRHKKVNEIVKKASDNDHKIIVQSKNKINNINIMNSSPKINNKKDNFRLTNEPKLNITLFNDYSKGAKISNTVHPKVKPVVNKKIESNSNVNKKIENTKKSQDLYEQALKKYMEEQKKKVKKVPEVKREISTIPQKVRSLFAKNVKKKTNSIFDKVKSSNVSLPQVKKVIEDKIKKVKTPVNEFDNYENKIFSDDKNTKKPKQKIEKENKSILDKKKDKIVPIIKSKKKLSSLMDFVNHESKSNQNDKKSITKEPKNLTHIQDNDIHNYIHKVKQDNVIKPHIIQNNKPIKNSPEINIEHKKDQKKDIKKTKLSDTVSPKIPNNDKSLTRGEDFFYGEPKPKKKPIIEESQSNVLPIGESSSETSSNIDSYAMNHRQLNNNLKKVTNNIEEIGGKSTTTNETDDLFSLGESNDDIINKYIEEDNKEYDKRELKNKENSTIKSEKTNNSDNKLRNKQSKLKKTTKNDENKYNHKNFSKKSNYPPEAKVVKNHSNAYKATDDGAKLHASLNKNEAAKIDFGADHSIYEGLLIDSPNNNSQSNGNNLPPSPSPNSNPNSSNSNTNNLNNDPNSQNNNSTASNELDSNGSSSSSSDRVTNPYDSDHATSTDASNVIYRIDGKEFEDRIPSEITLRIYDTDFRRKALDGTWMANLHSLVLALKFNESNQRKFDLYVDQESECEDQDYIIDDKYLKLTSKADCTLQLIMDNYKKNNQQDKMTYKNYILKTILGTLNEDESILSIQVGRDEYLMFYKVLDGNGKDVKVNVPKIENNQNKKSSLTDQVLSPYGVDGQLVNIGSPNQLNSITKINRCNESKAKFQGISFKQMSHKQYHEFKSACSWIDKQKKYLNIYSNIDEVNTCNCQDHAYWQDFDWQLQNAFNRLRNMYGVGELPQMEQDYVLAKSAYLMSFDQFHEDRFSGDVWEILSPELQKNYAKLGKLSLVMDRLEGPECGFRMAKKLVKKMVQSDKYKDMLFSDFDTLGMGMYIDTHHDKLWVSVILARKMTEV